MSDAAAFTATYADWKLVKTRSVVQIVFEAPIEKEAEVYAVLGGMPRAAEERWFAIARLNIKGTSGEAVPSPTTVSERTHLQSSEGTAGGGSSPEQARPRNPLLSEKIYKEICLQPKGRAFVEEFFQDILQGRGVNSADMAKDAIRQRLGIASLSEVDSDPVASEQAEQILRLKTGWERGYEQASRVQQENQA